MTKQEMIEVMDIYFRPIYEILGGLAAVFVITVAILLSIKPFIRKLQR